MSWKKLTPAVVALLLALPAVAIVQPAAAQTGTVPIAPTVPWVNQVNWAHNLYVDFEVGSGNSIPDCIENPSATEFRLDLESRQAAPGSQNTRQDCTFTAVGAGPTAIATSEISLRTRSALGRDVTVTGNDALKFQFLGSLPSGSRLDVTIRGGNTSVAGSYIATGNSATTSATIDVSLTDIGGRYTFAAGSLITVDLKYTAPSGDALSSWRLSDRGSHLQVRSIDALRAATWTQDGEGNVRSTFQPLAKDADATNLPRIVGYYAVESALGDQDSHEGGVPVFTITRNGQPVHVGANAAGTITGEYAAELSGSGRAVWRFPAEHLDYRGWAAGEYDVTVDKRHYQGNALKSGNEHRFILGGQSASFAAHPGEQLSHDVLRGGTTTYLLTLNNTGSANDTFDVGATFVSGTPSIGWGVSVGGPGANGGKVTVAPGEEKLVTVTVTAPFGNVGDSSIFLVTARSTVDPAAAESSLTLVSRISDAARRAVDVIVPATTVSFDPSQEIGIPVYVWNKGTRAANATLVINQTPADGWTVEFQVVNQRVDTVTLSSILPGDVAPAILRVSGPIGRNATHDVTLNGTLLGTPVVNAERVLHLAVAPTAGVKVDIFESINGVGHFAELQPCYVTGGANDGECNRRNPENPDPTRLTPDDNVNVVWFRTWITNTGRVTEHFDLSLATLQACNGRNTFAATQPDASDAKAFSILHRAPDGTTSHANRILLAPGQTGEVYVRFLLNDDPNILPLDGNTGSCSGNDRIHFAFKARGAATGVEGADRALVEAADTELREKAVLLEAVRRLDAYANAETPLVDLGKVGDRQLVGGIEVGKSATYYVRLTNAASHKTFTSGSTVHSADAVLRVLPVAEEGWNVSIRPRTADASAETNPFGKTLTLSNVVENSAEAWRDAEIEVRVTAPANATLLEGMAVTATLQASLAGETSTMTIKTIVTQFANVSLSPDTERILAHPAKPGPYLLHLRNEGSSAASVTLQATINPETTPDRGVGWNVALGTSSLTLPANSNRTVALLVTPPAGASPSQVGEVNVTWEYAPHNALEMKRNRSTRLFTEVVPADSISLTSAETAATAAPGGFANFTFTLVSSRPVHFRANATPIPQWSTFLSTAEGNLSPNVPQTITLVLRAAPDAVNGSTFSSVLRVVEVENGNNFDAIPVGVSILGGRPIAALSAPTLQKTVDRGSSRTFEVQVSNVGNAAGILTLEARTRDERWGAFITGVNDTSDPYVFLGPNELRTINLTVSAPLQVPENTVVPVEVIARTPGSLQTSQIVIQARIHDYGLTLSLTPARSDIVAGTAADVVLKVRNVGNDNDTLNLSYMGNLDLPEWTVEIPVDRVQLEPGAERELRAKIQSPTGQLPSARAYSFKFYAGSLGGAAVNVSKNETAVASVDVLRYVALDVDGDDVPELAVDADRDSRNGYESFRDVLSGGVQTQVVEATLFDSRTRFLLDVPADRHDGIADAWFDPEAVYAYEIAATHAYDVDGDRSPDYLIDTDRDGKVDRVYASDGKSYRAAAEVKALGDDRVQFLADTEGDDRFDRYYDPEAKRVTATQRVSGQDPSVVGIDTDGDGKVDKHYNPQSGAVKEAAVAHAADFFGTYWYFLVAFGLVLVVSVVLIVRRRRA